MTELQSPTRRRNANAASQARRRLSPDEREALIVEEAVNFFAEHGFEGKTRDLAKRLGIAQPLLYRYFPSKEGLIERVYEEVYVQRWNPAWEPVLTDRSQPLVERFTRFYKAYSDAVYDYVWVRIFVYSGLKRVDINDRYLSMVREKVLKPICIELRHAHGLPETDAIPISEAELEIAWGLHGMFFYRAIRHFVYNLPMISNVESAIENDVRIFLAGAPAAQKLLLTGQTE